MPSGKFVSSLHPATASPAEVQAIKIKVLTVQHCTSQDALAEGASRLCTRADLRRAALGLPYIPSATGLQEINGISLLIPARFTPLPNTRPPSLAQSLLQALPKVTPSVVDRSRSSAHTGKGGRGRTASISARAGQRPVQAGTKAPAPQDPAWRQIFLGEREGPRWQVKRDHHGGSNETGWRAAYSEIRACNKLASSKHMLLSSPVAEELAQ